MAWGSKGLNPSTLAPQVDTMNDEKVTLAECTRHYKARILCDKLDLTLPPTQKRNGRFGQKVYQHKTTTEPDVNRGSKETPTSFKIQIILHYIFIKFFPPSLTHSEKKNE